jgi:hypothetical protein
MTWKCLGYGDCSRREGSDGSTSKRLVFVAAAMSYTAEGIDISVLEGWLIKEKSKTPK